MSKPSISERALGIKEIPEKERPVAEVFRLQGEKWADAEADAYLAKELRDTVWERMRQVEFDKAQREGRKISLNEAGRLVTMSAAWEDHVTFIAEAKRRANHEWSKRKAIEIAHEDLKNRDSNIRHDKQLSRG